MGYKKNQVNHCDRYVMCIANEEKGASLQKNYCHACKWINLQKLLEYLSSLSTHAAKCSGNVVLGRVEHDGLSSIISIRCSVCAHSLLETSKKVKDPRGYSLWECNLVAF